MMRSVSTAGLGWLDRGTGSVFAFRLVMANMRPVTGYAGRKIARRLTRSIPWIGAFIALATLGSAIRRKGLVRGAIHSGLDAIPFVGGAKNLAEMARGRDFLPDKVRTR
jgi:hypothetical protein